ncbi:hypothetical protein [Fimbriiglobus ruber]|uniref:Uncharacterized protein n=1 Tax=Fimbriiglobus ruber TaxID=1908690 RepID=A0A225E9U0_9BACT|nr:hypothetical protein [Fimbriiglobus ruber]OWK46806.1 hypothetical protein FRUB_00505 [Fimbriiglobus ruber]
MIVLRSLVVLVVLLAVTTRARSQVPEAPMPHPPLDEVVKEYKRLGLPLPPAGMELIIIGQPVRRDDEDYLYYFLAFRSPPMKANGESKYWAESSFFTPGRVDECHFVPARPVVETIRFPGLVDDSLSLDLAVQCKVYGWDALAEQIYAKGRKQLEDGQSVFDKLHSDAAGYWSGRKTERGTDRKEILRRLKELDAQKKLYPNEGQPSLIGPRKGREFKEILRRLEKTVAPRTSKPGTVDALIDDMSEYCQYLSLYEREALVESDKACAELAALGFDAVPALIAHLNDDRLTRAYFIMSGLFGSYQLDVGQVVGLFLDNLSDYEFGISLEAGDYVDANRVRKWLIDVQKDGEQKWLTARALPSKSFMRNPELVKQATFDDKVPRTNRTILRAVRAKYPERLPELYRSVLQTYPETDSKYYVEEILASKLSREKKLTLLEEGISHASFAHRLNALNALARLDMASCRKRVIPLLKPLLAGTETNDEIFPLIEWANDRNYWDAFTSLVKKAPADVRGRWIFEFTDDLDRNPFRFGTSSRAAGLSEVQRYERLRFLAGFFDDQSIQSLAPEDRLLVETRDYLARRLVWRLPLLNCEGYPVYIPPTQDGPFSRLALRTIVRSALTRELERIRK